MEFILVNYSKMNTFFNYFKYFFLRCWKKCALNDQEMQQSKSTSPHLYKHINVIGNAVHKSRPTFLIKVLRIVKNKCLNASKL